MAGKKSKKKKGGEVPREIADSAHRVWLAGLGALSRAQDEGGKFFRQLVEKGSELEGRGREKVEELVGKARDAASGARDKVEEARTKARTEVESRGEELSSQISRVVDERVEKLLHRMGVPTRQEIQILTERVEALNRQVEKGQAAETPAKAASTAKKPATKKPATKKPAAKKPAAKKPAAKKTSGKSGSASGTKS